MKGKNSKKARRESLESLRKAVLHLAEVNRGLIEAQQINTRKLNELLARAPIIINTVDARGACERA